MNSLHKMQREDEIKRSIPRLRSQLDASVEKNRFLKTEIEQLKKEILRQKNNITSLQAQVANQKSILWNKSQTAAAASSGTTTSQGKEAQPAVFLEWPRTCTKESSPRVLLQNPPPTPKLRGTEAKFIPPPPPPPPPPPRRLQRRGGTVANSVRRVPEVIELYRSLTRMGGKHDIKSAITGIPTPMTARDMIGEIEKRSAYLLAVKSEVVSQAEFINFLSREVENASYKEMAEVETFVKWLDEELSYLVDERAVLKHFPQWPELKADAMREAAFNYRDLKNLETEISSFRDDADHQTTSTSLKLIKALQDKLESSVHNLEKVRDNAIKKYRDFKIPCQWMLDTGIISQLKSGSLKLVKVHMRRSATALQSIDIVSSEEQDLLLQSVRFAFQVHQFVGGFDEGSRQAFQELQKLASINIRD